MDDHYRKLENMMHSAPIVQLTGARAEIGRGRADITVPVKQDFFHAANALHGSIYFLALDNAAFFAVNSLVEEVYVLTIHFSIVIIRPVTSGTVKAVGKVTTSTATHFFADSVLYDSEGREIARGSGIFVKSRIKLAPEIGYK